MHKIGRLPRSDGRSKELDLFGETVFCPGSCGATFRPAGVFRYDEFLVMFLTRVLDDLKSRIGNPLAAQSFTGQDDSFCSRTYAAMPVEATIETVLNRPQRAS